MISWNHDIIKVTLGLEIVWEKSSFGEIVTNNDVLRSLQNILDINESTLAEIFKLANHSIDVATVSSFLKDENEEGYSDSNDEQITSFLNGLITFRRGKSDHNPVELQTNTSAITNNITFKKLRIAFELKEDDLIELMSLANYPVSKSELSSISRKVGHKHYRVCSDDLLMGLLVGLTFRQWK